jgi:hypothetical protein
MGALLDLADRADTQLLQGPVIQLAAVVQITTTKSNYL